MKTLTAFPHRFSDMHKKLCIAVCLFAVSALPLAAAITVRVEDELYMAGAADQPVEVSLQFDETVPPNVTSVLLELVMDESFAVDTNSLTVDPDGLGSVSFSNKSMSTSTTGGKTTLNIVLSDFGGNGISGAFDGTFLTFEVDAPPAVGTYAIEFGDGSFFRDTGFQSKTFAANDGTITAVKLFNANDDTDSTNEDIAVQIDVLANDSDEEGNAPVDAADVTMVTAPANGSAVINGDESITYTPAANFNGQDSFTYSAEDAEGNSDSGTVTVTVNAVNDAPVFTAGSDQTVNEDAGVQTVATWATGIGPGAADESGQTLTFNAANDNNALFATQPDVAADGTLSYQPAANANGSATVTVTLSDDGGTANGGADTSAEQSFTITVTPVNDAPSFLVGADQAASEDAAEQSVSDWATGISAGAADESGQALTFNVTTDNSDVFSLAPAIDSDGNLTYTPATTSAAASTDVGNGPGVATVTVALKDDGGTANGGNDTSAAQNFTITISPVNDAPVIDNMQITDSADLVHGGGIEVTVVASDEETPNANLHYTYSWSSGGSAILSRGPTTATSDTLSVAEQLAAGFDGQGGGNYPVTCEVTVADTATPAGTDTATESTFVGNQPPAITAASPTENPSIDEGQSQTFQATFDDSGHSPQDDGIASIVWYLNTNGQGFNQVQDNDASSETGPASDSYIFESDQDTQLHDGSNSFVVRAEVTDGQGVTRHRDWDLTVNDINNPPDVVNLKIAPRDANGDDVSTSKWEEITMLVAEHGVEDADAEDFPNGTPSGDDSLSYTWKMVRKGVNGGTPFTVPDTDGNPDILTEAEVENAMASRAVAGFLKGDNIQVVVTANDGVDAGEAMKTAVLGNPPWFPNFSWDPVLEGENYFRVAIMSAAAPEIVSLSVVGTELRTPMYLTAQWQESYLDGNAEGVRGLQPGNYSAVIERPDGQGGWELHAEQAVEVPDYAAPAVTISDADGVLANTFWTVKFDLAGNAAYMRYDDGAGSGDLTMISPGPDGSVPTDTSLRISREISAAGDYTVDIAAVNPRGVSDTATAMISVAPEDVGTSPNTAPTIVNWDMYPDGGNIDAIADTAVFAADQSGTADIPFAWNKAKWATSFFLLVQDRNDKPVPGLDRRRLPATDANRMTLTQSIKSGTYKWFVIARNDAGFSQWSPMGTFKVASDQPEPADTTAKIQPLANTDITFNVPANTVTINVAGKTANAVAAQVYIYDTAAGAIVYNDVLSITGGMLTVDDPDRNLAQSTRYIVQLLPVDAGGNEGNWTPPRSVVSNAGSLDAGNDFDVALSYASPILTLDFLKNEGGNQIVYEVSLVTADGRFAVIEEMAGRNAIDSATNSRTLDLSAYGIPATYAYVFVRARIVGGGQATGWAEALLQF